MRLVLKAGVLQMFYLLGESFLKLYLIYGIMSVLGLKWLKYLAGVLMQYLNFNCQVTQELHIF